MGFWPIFLKHNLASESIPYRNTFDTKFSNIGLKYQRLTLLRIVTDGGFQHLCDHAHTCYKQRKGLFLGNGPLCFSLTPHCASTCTRHPPFI